MTRQATSQHGAPSASYLWLSIDWQQIEDDVFRFQMRIARATKAQRWNKVRALQRLLTRSHQAKLLAVKRVTSKPARTVLRRGSRRNAALLSDYLPVFNMFMPTTETGKLWTKRNSKPLRRNWLKVLKLKLALTSFPEC